MFLRFGSASALIALAVIGSAQSVAWTKSKNGPTGTHDYPWRHSVDRLGNTVTAGITLNAQSTYDVMTVKHDAQGNEVWTRIFSDDIYGSLVEVATDSRNAVVLAFCSANGANGDDITVVKYDAAGNELWSTKLQAADPGRDFPWKVTVDRSDNIIVTGFGNKGGIDHMVLLKVSPTGNLMWAKADAGAAGTFCEGDWVATDESENIYVIGTTPTDTEGLITAWKYSPSGNLIWRNERPIPGYDYSTGYWGSLDAQGNVYYIGVGDSQSDTVYDGLVAKWDSNGNPVYLSTYNSSYGLIDYFFGGTTDSNGNLYAVGSSANFGLGTEGVIAKFNPSGVLEWTRTYSGNWFGSNSMSDSFCDAVGRVYVNGYYYGDPGDSGSAIMVMLDPAGNQLYRRDYNSQNGGEDDFYSLARDPWGDWVNAGLTAGPGTGADFLIEKASWATKPALTGLQIVRGFQQGGNLSSLGVSDNDRLVVRKGISVGVTDAPVQVSVTTTSAIANPSIVNVVLETSVTTVGLSQRVQLFNWVTNAYDTVDTRVISQGDRGFAVTVANNGRYVQSGTNKIDAKFSVFATGFVGSNTWDVSIDLLSFGLVP